METDFNVLGKHVRNKSPLLSSQCMGGSFICISARGICWTKAERQADMYNTWVSIMAVLTTDQYTVIMLTQHFHGTSSVSTVQGYKVVFMEEGTLMKPKSIILDCSISSRNMWRLAAHAQQAANTDCNIASNDPPCREKLNKPTDDKQWHLKKSV